MFESSMAQEFALCGLVGKEKVRTLRNDTRELVRHDVRMVRSGKTGDQQQIWYAREWLIHKGLKQADVVSRSSFNKGQVSDYLGRRRRWNEDVLVQFAHAIGVEPADLLRPPQYVENELARYVMKMDAKTRKRALKMLKATFEDEDDSGAKSA